MKTSTRSLISTLVIMSFLFLLYTSCKKNNSNNTSTGKAVYTIAVISDLHYMDPSLRPDTSNPKLKAFIAWDQRLPVESDAIMREVIQELINAKPKPDLVMVPGDLSFDGELVSHNAVAGFLTQLTSAGIKVRVINGNHDINFAGAIEFVNDTFKTVANIDPGRFKSIYANFGYSDALNTDTASLSYVSEPLPGLWLLSIDACIYKTKNNKDSASSGGSIRQATMMWALARLEEARAKGKMVFGMMHHALINHYSDQSALFPNNVVDRSSTASDSLMNGGLKLLFTGHGHSTDIVKKISGNNFLFDIETSATSAYPCSYRMITYIKDSALIISTIPITHINFPIPAGLTFQAYAKQRIRNSEVTDNAYFYKKPPYSYKPDTALRLARRMGAALMAQMAGDEQIFFTSESDSIEATIGPLGPAFLPIRTNWFNLWNDLITTTL